MAATSSAVPPTATAEQEVASFTPSRWSDFGTFFWCALFFWLIIPLIYLIWNHYKIKCTRYVVTNQRIRLTTGVFSKTTSNLELYRVTDVTMTQSFTERLFGIGNVDLVTTDRTTPLFRIMGVRDHAALFETIRALAESQRDRKRQREFDIV
jgi:uncharacterized membrane protein YdbT with pleckstrin-like domain